MAFSIVPNAAAARIVAGTLTLLAREVRETGPPFDLWQPALADQFIRGLAVKVAEGRALPLWAEDRHPARGLLVYSPSPWESEVLGLPCVRLEGPFLVVEDPRDRQERVEKLAALAAAEARRRGDRFLSIKVPADPAILRGFLARGFILAEIGASLALPVAVEAPPPAPPGFAWLDEFDQPEELAEQMGDFFYDGHHRHDPDLGPKVARHLWRTVAARDLAGAADPALMLWDRGRDEPAALATAKIDDGEAVLSILAVRPAWRGRGLGRSVMRALLARLAGRAARLRIETAAYNLPALRLYESLGARPTAPLVALHCKL